MNRIATLLLGFALAVVLSAGASAQDPTPVTVAEINDIPDADIQFLIDNAETLTDINVVEDRTASPLLGQTVEFGAVVLSDPYASGERTPDDDPINVLFFVRDTTAASQGPEGMGMLISDEGSAYRDANVRVGRVYTFQGEVTRFRTTTQLSVTAIEEIGPYQALGFDDSLVDPVVITTSDANAVVDADSEQPLQLNWANYESLVNQYVRLEGAEVVDRVQADDGRPGFLVSTVGEESALGNRDLSLRYRNDRATSDYANDPNFSDNVRDASDPFVPPSTGSLVNLQGFLTINSFDLFSVSEPNGAIFRINPWTDDDLELVELGGPVVGELSRPETVVGDEPVTISVDVTPTGDRTISTVTLNYTFSSGESGDVELTGDGLGTYSGDIPAAPDGDFVTYSIEAEDNATASTLSDEEYYRVFFGTITSIEQIQTTPNGISGPSPLAGAVADDLSITGVVQTSPETSSLLTIQDGDGAWDGIFIDLTTDLAGLERGDEVTITRATIREDFGNVTELQVEAEDIAISAGTGTPYPYAVLATGLLAQDSGTAESYEGVQVRFENVTVTDVNADGADDDDGFGEFQISSDGSEANEVRVDDQSAAIPGDYNITNLTMNAEIGFIQGVWSFSFGNYKLWPEDPETDINLGPVANEPTGESTPGRFVLDAAYPNPFNGTTSLRYEVGTAGPVSLRIYDAVGREVATLVDEALEAQAYTVTFDGSRLPAGVYFVRLSTVDQTLTQKIVRVK